jgi:hypothetical protein
MAQTAAATMVRLAQRQLPCVKRRGGGSAAAGQMAPDRHGGAEHARTGARTPDYARGRPSGAAPLEPGSTPAAAAIAGREGGLGEIAVIEERDRIGAYLRDNVIQRVFMAGLRLQGAAGLAEKPEVRRRIEAAIDELDHVIQLIRDAVFNRTAPVTWPRDAPEPPINSQ